MFLLNGNPLSPDSPFTTPEGRKFPANWLRLATPAERLAVGITEVSDPPYYDQRFYWGIDDKGQLIPKDHAQLVTQWVSQTRTTSNTLLAPSDWQIVRQSDNGTPIDANVKTWREEIRLACNEKVNSIKDTLSTEELAAYVTSPVYSVWPQLNTPPVPLNDSIVFNQNLTNTSADTIIFANTILGGSSNDVLSFDTSFTGTRLSGGSDPFTFL